MSSNSPPNYTEGVPIKISEKYKPPPEIHLPTRVLHQLAKASVPVAFDDDYDFNLERKIISKTSEWINIRLREKRERQERIHQRELQRQRQIEEEQKLKLNQVSYPSADEISSCDEDDEVAQQASKSDINNSVIPNEKTFSPTNFNTILVPTQAAPSGNMIKSHRRYASNSSNKIDFSFFESDTSPFDHLEMKSMNEMEMLAEVLGSTNVKVTTDSNNLERDNSSESDNSTDPKNNNGEQQQQQQMISNHQQQQQQHQQTQSQPIPQQQQQQQQNFVPMTYGASGFYGGSNFYGYGISPITAQQQQNNHFNYLQQHQPQHFSYPQNYAVNFHHNNSSFNSMMTNNNTIVNETNGKSEKRNIPSIIQELNDELNNSQRRRIRNHSQSSQKETSTTTTLPEVSKSPVDEEFNKLSMKTQTLATQISQMGFQRDLVIRAVSRIGENDKKVVEHLIPLSELLQMGFEEEQISEALIKFDNNKDRALDYLIS